ncbi:hypothetical protein AB6C93_08010 [Vibrio splendidus]
MLNKKHAMLAIALAILPMVSNAKKLSLVDSCVELINIYDSKSPNMAAVQIGMSEHSLLHASH